MADIKFEDNRVTVKEALTDAGIGFLHEIGGEFVSQTARNSRVDTGQTKGSWDYRVDEGNLQVSIGSPLENAIWEEFGTGEYALKGDGRKGGWHYKDEKTGKWHHTWGKTPTRALHNAFVTKKNAIIRRAEQLFGERLK